MSTTEKTIRANVDSRFYFRFLLIGIAALGFGLWSLYDGAVKYPNQRQRALAFEKLREELGGEPSDEDQEALKDKWNEYASERGWPTEYPGEPKVKADFVMQYVMATIAGTVGLWLLFVVLRSRGRWIEANESGLKSSWGQCFDFDHVTVLDKRWWMRKGIAKIKYQDGKRRRRFVLDNFKFDRGMTNMILYELESKIGTDKIFGGPPEPPPEEQDKEASESVPEKPDSPG